MKMSSLVGRRTKETPKDAELTSHKFLLRGGYIKQQSSGIFSILPWKTHRSENRKDHQRRNGCH